jgi:hypothetical protein
MKGAHPSIQNDNDHEMKEDAFINKDDPNHITTTLALDDRSFQQKWFMTTVQVDLCNCNLQCKLNRPIAVAQKIVL